MRIVKILGGLGNQMWQYAFLIALREARPQERVYYDASFFNGYPLHNGFELDRLFKITATQASKNEIRKVYHHFVGKYCYARIYRHCFPVLKSEIREVEVNPYQEDIITRDGDYYYDGYWADHRYYDGVKDVLKSEFQFKLPLDERNLLFLSELKNVTSCSIHVRRGDYLKDPDFAGICDEDYYKRAIIKARELRPEIKKYIIFSNDLSWCKEHIASYLKDEEVVYVDWNTKKDSYKDMVLMTKCDINIIANSSFSWWGAYLNENDSCTVIAPKRYKNVEMDFDIYPDEWIRI